MTDSYIYVVVALLPLAACMLVFQVDPYHALVIRGILGAVAALVYAVLGAADVALTEALVGTMLAITLYAIAVRSSMSMRLGVVTDPGEKLDAEIGEHPNETSQEQEQPALGQAQGQFGLRPDNPTPPQHDDDAPTPKHSGSYKQLLATLRNSLYQHYMRLEMVPYLSRNELYQAFANKEVHGICIQTAAAESPEPAVNHSGESPYQITLRVRRLYEIVQTECPSVSARLVDVDSSDVPTALEALSLATASASSEEAHR